MKLHEEYEDLAAIWRWAARAYVERAAKADGYSHRGDQGNRWTWNDAAIEASRRASRYARLAERCAPRVTVPAPVVSAFAINAVPLGRMIGTENEGKAVREAP